MDRAVKSCVSVRCVDLTPMGVIYFDSGNYSASAGYGIGGFGGSVGYSNVGGISLGAGYSGVGANYNLNTGRVRYSISMDDRNLKAAYHRLSYRQNEVRVASIIGMRKAIEKWLPILGKEAGDALVPIPTSVLGVPGYILTNPTELANPVYEQGITINPIIGPPGWTYDQSTGLWIPPNGIIIVQ